GMVSETTPIKPTTPYGIAKAEAERSCQKYSDQGVPIVILRPSNIYGPFSETWTVSYAERLQSRRWGTLGDRGEGTCNLVHVSDVVRAIALSMKQPSAIGQNFNISGDEPITWNRYFELFNRVLGLPELDLINPNVARGRAIITQPIRATGKYMLKNHRDALVWLCNHSNQFKTLLKKMEERLKSTANLDDMRWYQLKVTYSIEKARQLLSYAPEVALEEGLLECRAWLQHSGLLRAA